MINWEEILNFTPINHLLRPDYLGVGTTGVEGGREDLGPSALDPFTLAEFRIKVFPPLSNFKIWSLLY